VKVRYQKLDSIPGSVNGTRGVRHKHERQEGGIESDHLFFTASNLQDVTDRILQ
jgi:hypothetical protein